MKKIILAAFLFSTIMVGCKKDKDQNCDLSNERLVGTYKLTAINYKAAGSTTSTNVFLLFTEACERDDLYVFNSNNTFEYVDAGSVCSPAGHFNSSWSLSGNTLIFDGESFTVATFDCTTMSVKISDPTSPGDEYTFSYARQ